MTLKKTLRNSVASFKFSLPSEVFLPFLKSREAIVQLCIIGSNVCRYRRCLGPVEIGEVVTRTDYIKYVEVRGYILYEYVISGFCSCLQAVIIIGILSRMPSPILTSLICCVHIELVICFCATSLIRLIPDVVELMICQVQRVLGIYILPEIVSRLSLIGGIEESAF